MLLPGDLKYRNECYICLSGGNAATSFEPMKKWEIQGPLVSTAASSDLYIGNRKRYRISAAWLFSHGCHLFHSSICHCCETGWGRGGMGEGGGEASPCAFTGQFSCLSNLQTGQANNSLVHLPSGVWLWRWLCSSIVLTLEL